MDQLFQTFVNAGLIDGDNIILNKDEVVMVSKDVFSTFFGDVSINPTYEALSGSHTFMWGDPPVEYTRTAEELGYQGYFDAWKAEGII